MEFNLKFTDTNTQGNASNLSVTYTGQLYPTDNPTIEGVSTFRHENIDGFTETSTKAGSDEIKYILKKDSAWYYWTGSAWAVSDETYSQSTTAADIETNKASFTAIGVTTTFRAFLHSDDGSTTPQLDAVVIDYDFSGAAPDTVNTCIVWGYLYDESGTAVSGATVQAYLKSEAVQYQDNVTIQGGSGTAITDTTNGNGYWELTLVETVNMAGTEKYIFTINTDTYERSVPNETTKNFWDLT